MHWGIKGYCWSVAGEPRSAWEDFAHIDTSCQWREGLPSQESSSSVGLGRISSCRLSYASCRHLFKACMMFIVSTSVAWEKRRGQVTHITAADSHHIPIFKADRSQFQSGFVQLAWTESIWNLCQTACTAPGRSEDFSLVLTSRVD